MDDRDSLFEQREEALFALLVERDVRAEQAKLCAEPRRIRSRPKLL